MLEVDYYSTDRINQLHYKKNLLANFLSEQCCGAGMMNRCDLKGVSDPFDFLLPMASILLRPAAVSVYYGIGS